MLTAGVEISDIKAVKFDTPVQMSAPSSVSRKMASFEDKSD